MIDWNTIIPIALVVMNLLLSGAIIIDTLHDKKNKK